MHPGGLIFSQKVIPLQQPPGREKKNRTYLSKRIEFGLYTKRVEIPPKKSAHTNYEVQTISYNIQSRKVEIWNMHWNKKEIHNFIPKG